MVYGYIHVCGYFGTQHTLHRSPRNPPDCLVARDDWREDNNNIIFVPFVCTQFEKLFIIVYRNRIVRKTRTMEMCMAYFLFKGIF